MQAFYDAAGAGGDLKEMWSRILGSIVEPIAAHIRALLQEGRVDIDHPAETIQALAVGTDRYLLDVYSSNAETDIETPTAVLEQIWSRSLRLT